MAPMAEAEHTPAGDPQAAEPAKPGTGPVVLNFDSALAGGDTYPFEAVHEIYRWSREGHDVLAVVAAPEAETDMLFALAERVGDGGRSAHLPRLLRIGELRSAAVLALALERAGLKASVMDPHEMDLRAEGDPHDAALTGCDADGLRAALAANHVVVVPGYFALGEGGDLAMLGRRGSDYTAAFLGQILDASRVRMIRSEDGLYQAPGARYAQLDWAAAEREDGALVQPKALGFAARAGQALEVAAPARGYATVIQPGPARTEAAGARRMRVALLGCGTVGGGLFQYIQRYPDLFEISKILVRTIDSPRYEALPKALLTEDPDDPAILEADFVAESIGGLTPAADLVIRALERGQDVATANKEIFARRFDALSAAAGKGGAELRASASVGGGVPVLEAVDIARAEGRGFTAIEGVTNGTANFVLDEMEAGKSLDEAVKLAQDAGYAEADPTADVDGWDAAAKVSILARRALGVEISPDEADRDSLRSITLADIKAAQASGQRVRQVGAVRRDGNGVKLSVKLVALPQDSFLAGARGPENRFKLSFADGSERRVSGLGAGRWPTAEAMFADLLDLHRLRAQPGAAQD